MDIVPASPTAVAADLTSFREALYASFTSWPDALFELTDATLTASGPVSSVPHLLSRAEVVQLWGGDVGQVGVTEEPADDVGHLLQAAECGDRLAT